MKQLLLSLVLAGAACLSGCGQDEPITPVPQPKSFQGTLDVDIRGHAVVTVTVLPNGVPSVELTVDSVNALRLLEATTKLSASGRMEAFPENDSSLITAKFAQPAVSGGPCGDQPVSLALSLHRRGTVTRVGGSITVYCGKDHFFGVPLRILRLSGELPAK
ncbi:MAG: hypothetical protein ABI193_06850 [Minicystis sp.]